jgi:hypothetical protein
MREKQSAKEGSDICIFNGEQKYMKWPQSPKSFGLVCVSFSGMFVDDENPTMMKTGFPVW